MKKNGFLTFMCALVPGCGQMYQGYMKRGLSLMCWFAASVVVPMIVGNITWFYAFQTFMLFGAVVWAYSFFDTFNLRSLTQQQHAETQDEFLPRGGFGNSKNMPKFKLNVIVGWVLMLLGALIIFKMFWDPVYRFLWEFSPAVAQWLSRLPGLVIALIVILVGIRMLRGRKKAESEEPKSGQNDTGYYLPNATEDNDEQ